VLGSRTSHLLAGTSLLLIGFGTATTSSLIKLSFDFSIGIGCACLALRPTSRFRHVASALFCIVAIYHLVAEFFGQIDCGCFGNRDVIHPIVMAWALSAALACMLPHNQFATGAGAILTTYGLLASFYAHPGPASTTLPREWTTYLTMHHSSHQHVLLVRPSCASCVSFIREHLPPEITSVQLIDVTPSDSQMPPAWFGCTPALIRQSAPQIWLAECND
jgi:hypothetical protein